MFFRSKGCRLRIVMGSCGPCQETPNSPLAWGKTNSQINAENIGLRRMTVRGANGRIVREVMKLNGVIASSHRFGGSEFRLGRRELGHIHGDQWADIVFPMEVRNRLVAEGKVEPHHILGRSGWITFRFEKEEDVDYAIGLFGMS